MKKIYIQMIIIFLSVIVISGCITPSGDGAYEMEWIHISIFTEDGQPSMAINYEVNNSINENLTQSSFKVVLEILGTDFYHEYSLPYNKDMNNPKLIPPENISGSGNLNVFSNFVFKKEYTFQIRLEINTTNLKIKEFIFFGGDNIVDGYFVAIDNTYDKLEYKSDDFDFEYHTQIGEDEIFKVSENLIFRIGDGGIATN